MDMDSEIRQRHGSLDKGSKNGDTASISSSGDTEIGLKRSVGLFGGISLIIGVMIGSGIFISPKGVLEGGGSVGMALMIWFMGGLLSMFGAISYAELGTMIPKSGGEYAYLMESLHPVFAFLFAFVSTLLLKPSSVAIICMSCAEYILTPMFDDGCGSAPPTIMKLVAFTALFVLAAINVTSVKVASQVQIIFTIAKLLALAIIIMGGLVKLGQGYTDYLQNGFEGTNNNLGEIAIGFYSSMWAYDGWNNLNLVTEELQEPHKNLPRAIFIGIPLVTVLYILTNISYFTVLSPEALLASPAVAVSWAELVIPNFAWTIPIFVAMSTFGAANGSLFSSGRLIFVAAREQHMVKVLSFVHVHKFTPSAAIMFTAIVGSFMIIPSNIGSLIDFFSFAAWMFYALVFACLVYLRYKRPDVPRPYKVPLVFPIIAFFVSVFLVLAPIIQAPQIEFLYAFLFIVGGLIFYFPFVHFKKEIPGLAHVNVALQQLLQVAPPDSATIEDKIGHEFEVDVNKVYPVDIDSKKAFDDDVHDNAESESVHL